MAIEEALRKPDLGNALLLLSSVGLGLCVLLLPIRADVMDLNVLTPFRPRNILPMILMGYYDAAYGVLLTGLFAIMILLFRNRPRAQARLNLSFLILALLSVLVAVLNIKVVEKLGTPFNYPWLYYSDFLRSHEARQAILLHLSWGLVLMAAAFLMGFLILVILLRIVLTSLRGRIGGTWLAFGAFLAMLLYFPTAKRFVDQPRWALGRLENPVVFFMHSMLNRPPLLLAIKTPFGPDDFLPKIGQRETGNPFTRKTPANIRNVILVVLESVPAEYVDIYGSTYRATPTLNQYRGKAAIFKNVFAQTPATATSLVALLCAMQPWISYRSITAEYPAVPLPSISRKLRERGYRTGFFNSAGNAFNGIGKFLSYRGFDRIEDYRDRICKNRLSLGSGRSLNLAGSDDLCTADSMIRWLQEDPGKPFFSMLWTGMTHYPYFLVGEAHDYGTKDEMLNRYLTALHRGDMALAKILLWLEQEKLIDSTLVVVVGDHGEAFGQHNQIGHGFRIYEETIHVPLVLIQPTLFQGEEFSTIGMLCDIAPTIMHLLQLSVPEGWQGRNLFDSRRTERAYFGVFWSDRLFGYREGNRKFIFNETRNTYEIYDLQSDPFETNNLSRQFPAEATLGLQRLASWVQFQDRWMKSLIARTQKAP